MTSDTNPSELIKEAEGPPGLFCVFEDDGDTGYLYVYQPDEKRILGHLHLYDRSADLKVAENDVIVVWSADKSKCGVVIWGKMRGIIDLASGREDRVWIDSRDTPGIGDAEWLAGFPLNSNQSKEQRRG